MFQQLQETVIVVGTFLPHPVYHHIAAIATTGISISSPQWDSQRITAQPLHWSTHVQTFTETTLDEEVQTTD